MTFLHYSDYEAFCDISEGLSCSVVNKSIQSELFGIPVAILGFLTFVVLFILLYLILKDKEINVFDIKFDKKAYAGIILILLIMSTVFSAYLIYVQAVLLLSYCVLCLFLDAIIYISLILSIILYLKVK